MNPHLHPLRLLWIGPEAPDAGALLTDATAGAFEIRIDLLADVEAALARVGKGVWDVVVVDQALLPDAALHCLNGLTPLSKTGETIVLVDARVALPTAAQWTCGLQRPRLLMKPVEPEVLVQLLRQIMIWRQSPEEKKGAEVPDSPWLHSELARLTQQATIDQLTGLLRREEMFVRATEEFNRALRSNQHLLCIMGDIDHFKHVNDVFGHPLGDVALSHVAALFKSDSRPYDLVGRVGGEEFMFLLPGPTLEIGQRIAERLRLAIQNFNWAAQGLPPITMSFGVSELREGSFKDFGALSKAADLALYEAKRLGRNQVRVAYRAELAEPILAAGGRENSSRLLIVDDAPIYLDALVKLLGARYLVEATTDPRQALAWAEQRSFELILADENMPGVAGHELLERVKGLQPQCVRILMTSHGELTSAIQAINQAEVYRYLLKPWRDEDLLLTIHQALEYRAMVIRLRESDRETIKALADLIELRDRSTRGHYTRVADLSLKIAAGRQYTQARLDLIEHGAWLHDIGKIGIPDSILHQKHPLSEHEERILREHPQLGAALVSSVEHLAAVAPFIRHHHERFDGHGYPDGLAGKAIPEESRIIAIANAFDDLLRPRHGRPALTRLSLLGYGFQLFSAGRPKKSL